MRAALTTRLGRDRSNRITLSVAALAVALGFLLGRAVIPALVLGVVGGGLWPAGLLATRRPGLLVFNPRALA